MSRLQTGTVTTHVQELHLQDVVTASVAALGDQGSRVRAWLPEDLPLFIADAGLLDRVLADLLENALKHSPGRQEVVIGGSVTRSRIQIRVVDRGTGVADDLKDRIFAPFQRFGDAPSGEGVGLGLAVARGLTEAMDGTLTAEDTPGGGLTIVIDLPWRARRHEPWSSTRREQLTTFVLVDDEQRIVRTLTINLRARDYEVEAAGDGRSALRVVKERSPDVIVLDLGLPDMDGVDVLRRIRETSVVPVIVLSARQDTDDKVEALDAGADDYVTKPFGMDEFQARVRAAARPRGTTTEAIP